MTYMSIELDRLCRSWCPLADVCEQGHLCEDMKKIRKIITKISKAEIDD